MKLSEKHRRAAQKSRTIRSCILLGMECAARCKLTKPSDVALCIEAALDDGGLNIIRKPGC